MITNDYDEMPIRLLGSIDGAKIVQDVLTRIDHGVHE